MRFALLTFLVLGAVGCANTQLKTPVPACEVEAASPELKQCISQPEAVTDLRHAKATILECWILPPNDPDNSGAEVRFSLDASGDLQCLSFTAFSSKPMAGAIRRAFETAAPPARYRPKRNASQAPH